MNKLDEIIKSNNFIKPNYNDVNFVDLVKTIYRRFGKNYELTGNIKLLDGIIPQNKHILFILSDGTGANVIHKLNDNTILKKNMKKEIVTIFPSTTACVLTSLATASYPQEHGIWGWLNYNKKYDKNYLPVLFKDRITNLSLTDYNIKPEDIYIKSSVLKELNTKTNILFPDYIIDSVYSKFVAHDEDRLPYSNFEDIKQLIKGICENNKKSFTYLYLPQVDRLEHDNGIDSEEVLNLLYDINKLIEDLTQNKDLTIIFTADHGQTNVYKDVVMDFKKYNKYFYALPSIDCGTASYYVKEEYKDEFEKEFEKDFKDDLFLFETDEFISNNLFGKEVFDKIAIENIGEYISICKKGSFFINSPNKDDYYGKVKGNHTGLTEDEMIIPLIVIDTNNMQ